MALSGTCCEEDVYEAPKESAEALACSGNVGTLRF